VRNSIWATFGGDFVKASLSAIIAESITVSYVYFLFYLINYLKDPEAPYTDGIWLVCVYSAAVAIATLFRNYYIFLGYAIAIRMRKAIVSTMYDKVGKLSIKSLTQTNSGKLITIISGDIFVMERAICLMPILPASPIVLLLCLFYIARSSGILYSVITLVIWIGCIIGQLICNKYTRLFKSQDARLSDQRMKLVNDLVAGIRTIKSYAWENHYLRKIKEVRSSQNIIVFKHNMVASLGFSLF
jgi:ABC-type multidrug transport system fused ATPase/permease subunit